MILFEDVTFAYDRGRDVLGAADIAFGPGLTLLCGPNGCGKSTLLKLAAGVERPDRGRVLVDGLDLWRDEAAARRGLAYLPEFPDVTPYATIREVLRLVCRLRGEPPRRADEVLALFGLADETSRTIRELSSGQRKRALFAAAFVGAPGNILLDEPLDALDRGMADRTIRWAGERAAAGATVVVVTHDFEPFAGFAGRAITLRAGRPIVHEPLPADDGVRRDLLERLSRDEAPSARDPAP